MKVFIRPMKEDDIENILIIENSSFSVPWTRQAFEEELNNEMALYLCLELDGRVIAYVGIWRILDEGHITNVAVLPEYRGLGFAKLLLKEMFSMCIENEITAITLEVRESNASAIVLYEGLGFKNRGKRPKYYKCPDEDAIIMWKELK